MFFFFFVLVQKACTLVPEVKLFQTCLCGAADCCAFQVAAAGGVLQGQSPGGGGGTAPGQSITLLHAAHGTIPVPVMRCHLPALS